MTCQDCIHYDVCLAVAQSKERGGRKHAIQPNECRFKDKAKFIELPCKVGDMVYSFSDTFGAILPYEVQYIHVLDNTSIQFEATSRGYDGELLDAIDFELDDVGGFVFLTCEEAEKSLEEKKYDQPHLR